LRSIHAGFTPLLRLPRRWIVFYCPARAARTLPARTTIMIRTDTDTMPCARLRLRRTSLRSLISAAMAPVLNDNGISDHQLGFARPKLTARKNAYEDQFFKEG